MRRRAMYAGAAKFNQFKRRNPWENCIRIDEIMQWQQ
jgi:hypothetical protein